MNWWWNGKWTANLLFDSLIVRFRLLQWEDLLIFSVSDLCKSDIFGAFLLVVKKKKKKERHLRTSARPFTILWHFYRQLVDPMKKIPNNELIMKSFVATAQPAMNTNLGASVFTEQRAPREASFRPGQALQLCCRTMLQGGVKYCNFWPHGRCVFVFVFVSAKMMEGLGFSNLVKKRPEWKWRVFMGFCGFSYFMFIPKSTFRRWEAIETKFKHLIKCKYIWCRTI